MENALPRPFLIGTMIVRRAYIFRICKISKTFPTLKISLQLVYIPLDKLIQMVAKEVLLVIQSGIIEIGMDSILS